MIEPTPALFYQIISDTFKEKAVFATKAVSKIELVDPKNKQVPTMCIGKEGIIFINSGFWAKMVRTKLDAKIVLLHEMFHSVLGDTSKDITDKIEHWFANMSMDMRINAAITQCFLTPQEFTAERMEASVLCQMYKESGIYGLLRPFSIFGKNSKYQAIYAGLYNNTKMLQNQQLTEKAMEIFESEESIREALKLLIPKDKRPQFLELVFLGTHKKGDEETDKGPEEAKAVNTEEGKTKNQEIDIGEPDDALKEAIQEALGDKLEDAKSAGLHGVLTENLVKVIKAARPMNLKNLDQFSCSKKVNEMKTMFKKQHRVSSVIPTKPTTRDLVLLSAGMHSGIWRNKKEKDHNLNRNVAIYVDVSGSVTHWIPKLLGLIASINNEIKTIYAFSTEVHEHSTSEMSTGKYKTTGGTDFGCIFTHAFENNIDKIIVMTDGYAGIGNHSEEEVKKRIKDIAVVYFGDMITKDNFFEKVYKKSFLIEELM